MSFNFKQFLSRTAEDSTSTETMLDDKRSDKAPDAITEKTAEPYRGETESRSTEKLLERKRSEDKDHQLTEGQLNDSKSKIVQHRNPDMASGNLNKLDEQRKGKDKFEKAAPSSKTDEDAKFWKVKSPDGLKIAGITKIADDEYDLSDVTDELLGRDRDDDDPKDLNFDIREERDPAERDPIDEDRPGRSDDPGEKDIDKMLGEFGVSVPEVETGYGEFFTEEVQTDSSTGTPIKISVLRFDPESQTIRDLFETRQGFDKQEFLAAAVAYLQERHPDLQIAEGSIDDSKIEEGILTALIDGSTTDDDEDTGTEEVGTANNSELFPPPGGEAEGETDEDADTSGAEPSVDHDATDVPTAEPAADSFTIEDIPPSAEPVSEPAPTTAEPTEVEAPPPAAVVEDLVPAIDTAEPVAEPVSEPEPIVEPVATPVQSPTLPKNLRKRPGTAKPVSVPTGDQVRFDPVSGEFVVVKKPVYVATPDGKVALSS